MAVAFVLDFHLRNVKFTAVVNITFDFDAGADVELVTAVAFNFGTGVSFESLASDHPSRILCGGHFFNFSVKRIIIAGSESGQRETQSG